MIIVIQIIVILIAVVIAMLALRERVTHSGKAWKKILLFMMAILMIIAVLFPDLTNSLARLVGVGRGADLLLYLTVLVFIVYALNNYLNQQDQRDRVFRLARRVALMEAEQNTKNAKKKQV